VTGSTPPWVSPKGAALLALESLVALAAGALSYALLAPTVPVTELELAGSAAKAGEILGGRRTDFLRAVDADWVLIAGYALALVFAAQLGRHVFWTAGARAAARFAGIAGVVAAAADAVENLLLRHALTTEAGDGWWQAAQAAAFTKFGLLALAAPVALKRTPGDARGGVGRGVGAVESGAHAFARLPGGGPPWAGRLALGAAGRSAGPC